MKHILSVAAIAAFALLVTGVAASADETGALPTPNPAVMQIMEQTHTRMEQLHSQARLAMLNALSPAHRNLLAQVVGQLAIAPNPDPAAAARQLDLSLTQGEGRAILSISSSLEQQSRQLMEASRQQIESAMPAGSATHALGVQHVRMMQKLPGGDQWRTDPGMILLGMAARTAGVGDFHFMAMPPGGPNATFFYSRQ